MYFWQCHESAGWLKIPFPSLLILLSSLLFTLYSAHHLHTICTSTNNCNLIFYSYGADVHLFLIKHVIDDGVFQLYMKTPYSNL